MINYANAVPSLARCKFPRCWIGKQIATLERPISAPVFRAATEDDIETDCKCTTPMQAFTCNEGHLSECHVGKSCAEAQCSHLERYVEDWKVIEPNEGDQP